MTEKVRKTAQEKAQEALDLATRKMTAAKGRLDKATEAKTKAEAEVDTLVAEVEYLSKHPALTQPTEVEAPAAPEAAPAQPTLSGTAPF